MASKKEEKPSQGNIVEALYAPPTKKKKKTERKSIESVDDVKVPADDVKKKYDTNIKVKVKKK